MAERDDPVVATVLAGFVVAVAPQMRGRVDAPRYVPGVDRAIDDTPQQPLQANLITAGERAVHPIADAQPRGEKQHGVDDVHPEVQTCFVRAACRAGR